MKNNFFKKTAISLMAFIILSTLFCVSLSFAAGNAQPSSATGISNPLKTNDLIKFISDALSEIVKVGAVLCVLALVFVGFKYVSAMGNSDKISKAHDMLLWTIVGIALLLGAQVLAVIIKGTVDAITKP